MDWRLLLPLLSIAAAAAVEAAADAGCDLSKLPVRSPLLQRRTPWASRARALVQAAWIDDGYCDCGRDEARTGACAGHSASGQQFMCSNAGFRPVPIAAAHVRDGVCDCCDGSDEL